MLDISIWLAFACPYQMGPWAWGPRPGVLCWGALDWGAGLEGPQAGGHRAGWHQAGVARYQGGKLGWETLKGTEKIMKTTS